MTRFFAHARKGDCTSQSETNEHLLAKVEIAKAAEAAGWHATTEKSGATPFGDCWTADVLAYKGKSAVAFEVQWSNQSDVVTALRQERYKLSSVRGLWLFRQEKFVCSKEIPAFRLVLDAEKNSFCVKLGDGSFSRQTIDLQRFIGGALTGSLKFAPAIGHEIPLEILGDEMDCWKCKRTSRIITHFNIACSRLFQGFDDCEFSMRDIEDESIAPELLKQILPSPSALKRAGVGQVKKRYSKTVQHSYISNGCVHCDSLFGSFYIHPSYDPIKLFESKIQLSAELVAAVNAIAYGVESWWFDESATCRTLVD